MNSVENNKCFFSRWELKALPSSNSFFVVVNYLSYISRSMLRPKLYIVKLSLSPPLSCSLPGHVFSAEHCFFVCNQQNSTYVHSFVCVGFESLYDLGQMCTEIPKLTPPGYTVYTVQQCIPLHLTSILYNGFLLLQTYQYWSKLINNV